MSTFKLGAIIAGAIAAAAGLTIWFHAAPQVQTTPARQAAAAAVTPSARPSSAPAQAGAPAPAGAPPAAAPGITVQAQSSPAAETEAETPPREVTVHPGAGSEWLSFTGGGETPAAVQPEVTRRDDGYTIHIRLPGVNKLTIEESGAEYAALEVPGWGRLQEVGKPSVPVKNILLDIPDGVEPVVRVTRLARVKAAPLSIYPAQPPYPDVRPEPPRPPFQKDGAIYDSNELWPASQVFRQAVSKLRNRRLLSIEVTPVQVRAASREALVAESLDLTVVYEKKKEVTQESNEALPEGFTNGVPSRYLILTHDKYATNATLQTFMDWKRRKGYDVRLVKSSEIDPGGAPTNGQVVAFMRALAATNYPEYLLIIGDHTPTNGIQGQYMITEDGGWSDLALACRDDSDYFPDLYHGRLPATSDEYLTRMLASVLAMDRTPSTNAMYQKTCVAGMLQDSTPTNNVADRLFCETADLIACYFEQRAGFTCQRAVVNPNGANSNCLWNSASLLWNSTNKIGSRVSATFVDATTAHNRIINNLNSGIALLQHRDHGYSGGYGWADPELIEGAGYTHVSGLTNTVNKPAVFSINCASGAYHLNRFLRAWFQNAQGGAYAVFAPVDISYSWYNDWLTHGFYAAFLTNYISFQNTCASPAWAKHLPAPGGTYGAAGSCTRLGQILNFGKLYLYENYSGSAMQDTFKMFHVFGDPEAFLQLATPAAQSVGHPANVATGLVTVTLTDVPVGAQVCLSSAELGLQRVTNAAAATVAIPIQTASTGTVGVTVTACGYRPYEGVIQVTSGNGTLQFNASAANVDEAAGNALLTVIRAGGASGTASVNYATTDGTAAAGTDYTAAAGQLAWADGNAEGQTITVPIFNRLGAQGQRSFSVVLSGAAGAALGSPDSATVTITVAAPAAPTGVSASDGSYTDKVLVAWSAVSNATGCRIYRHTSADAAGADQIGSAAAGGANYADTGAVAGTTYYYWVKATNAAGASDFSAYATGSRAAVSPALSAPENVQASDGTCTNKIQIAWNAVGAATSYQVWRNTTNASSSAGLLATTSSTNYDDAGATTPGLTLYYWVKARNDSGVSAFSQPDAGYCGTSDPTVTADLALRGFLFQPAVLAINAHPEMVMLLAVNNGPDSLLSSGIGFDFFLSRNPVFGDGDDEWIGDYQAAVSLPAGGYTSVIVSDAGLNGITIPPTADGAYYVFARVRHASAILDPNLADNTALRDGAIVVGADASAGAKAPVAGDFDGDRQADPCVYQESTGNWQVKLSGGGYGLAELIGFGGEGWKATSGDYDGDRKADPAVYQASTGNWRIKLSASGYAEATTSLGGLGYVSVPGDFNGGGCSDLAVYREATGYWLCLLAETVAPLAFKFGQDGYAPVSGDFTGDGATDPALYQASAGCWLVKQGDAVASLAGFGGVEHQPVGGDYDGDGKADLMLYQAGAGNWMVRLSGSGYALATLEGFGGPDYVPVAGDYDGDGKADLALFNAATATWLFRLSALEYAQFSMTF